MDHEHPDPGASTLAGCGRALQKSTGDQTLDNKIRIDGTNGLKYLATFKESALSAL
jgi:hypothetical protein